MSLRRAHILSLCGFLAFAAAETPARAAAPPGDGATFGEGEAAIRSVERAIARERIQRDMPAADADKEWTWRISPEVARVLLWGGVIFGVVVVVMAMREALPGWDRSRRLEAEAGRESLGAAGRDAMAAARLEADDLARAGRYAEAMHVLLLRSLAELRDKLKLTFADSLTSREILRRAPLGELGRAAFAEIVRAVERVVFGGARADEAAYRACRESYEALRRSLLTPGGA
jgi:Domain of unknown function (DUF4129)